MFSRITTFSAQILCIICLAAAQQGMFRMDDGQTAIPFPVFENSQGITIYLRFTARKCEGRLLEITSENSDQFFLLKLKSNGSIRFLFKGSTGSGQISIHPPPGDSFCSGKKYLLTLRRYLDDIQYRVNRGKRFVTKQQVLRGPFPRMHKINVGFGFDGCISGIDVLFYRSKTDKHTVGFSKGCVQPRKPILISRLKTSTTPREILTTSTRSKSRKESMTLLHKRRPTSTKPLPSKKPTVTQTARQTLTNTVTQLVKGTISKREMTVHFTSLPISKTSKIEIPRCGPLPPMCAGLGYNQTLVIGTKYPKEHFKQFLPFIRANCSIYLKDILCGYYFPSCPYSKPRPLQLCRELCLKAKYDCAPLMKAFEFEWTVDCEGLPSRSEGKCTPRPVGKTATTLSPESDRSEISNEIITLRSVMSYTKPPRNRRCGGILRQPTGLISTPNYPQPYPPDALCKWEIILPEVYHVINFIIKEASLESEPNCGYDYLLFKDGLSNQVGPKMCGFLERPRFITVKGHTAVILFRSDSALNKKGILIQYGGRWR